MLLSRIGFGEPPYVSKYGSKPLQDKYKYKTDTDGCETGDTYKNKSYKKNKAKNFIATAAIIAASAFAIYKGKGPIIEVLKKAGGAAGKLGKTILKPFKAAGSSIGGVLGGIGKTVLKPFKAIGSFIGNAVKHVPSPKGIGSALAKPFKAIGSFIGGLVHKNK